MGGALVNKLRGDLSLPFFPLCYFDEVSLLPKKQESLLATFPYLETVVDSIIFLKVADKIHNVRCG